MKYLIVGLGNIGAEYEQTRHNIGFEVLDNLAAKKGVTFQSGKYASFSEIKHRGRQLILIKPTTYMNLSGKALRFWMQQEKIDANRVLVVLDDLNLPFGKIRIRPNGSSGGHNGLKNIEEMLGSTQYPRLRMGIGDTFRKGQQVDYVLGRWSEEEKKTLDDFVDRAANACLDFANMQLGQVMTKYN